MTREGVTGPRPVPGVVLGFVLGVVLGIALGVALGVARRAWLSRRSDGRA